MGRMFVDGAFRRPLNGQIALDRAPRNLLEIWIHAGGPARQ